MEKERLECRSTNPFDDDVKEEEGEKERNLHQWRSHDTQDVEKQDIGGEAHDDVQLDKDHFKRSMETLQVQHTDVGTAFWGDSAQTTRKSQSSTRRSKDTVAWSEDVIDKYEADKRRSENTVRFEGSSKRDQTSFKQEVQMVSF